MWTISLSRRKMRRLCGWSSWKRGKRLWSSMTRSLQKQHLIYASIDYPLLVPHWTQVLPLRNDYAMCPPCIQINIMQKVVLSQNISSLTLQPPTEISCWLTVAFDGVIIYILSDLVEGGLHEIRFLSHSTGCFGRSIRKIRKVLNLHLSYLLLFKCNKCKLRGRPYFFCT